MRTILVGLFFIAGLCANAATVTFAWDGASDSTVVGYAIVLGTNAPVTITNTPAIAFPPSITPTVTTVFTNFTRIDVGYTLSATIELPPGKWYVAARSYNNTGDSENSNMLTLEAPPAPVNFRLVIVEATVDVSGTNWQQVGMFRLKLP